MFTWFTFSNRRLDLKTSIKIRINFSSSEFESNSVVTIHRNQSVSYRSFGLPYLSGLVLLDRVCQFRIPNIVGRKMNFR